MLYIIQNDPEVPPGLIITELDRLAVTWTLVHGYRGEPLPDLAHAHGLIVMGGAMGANDDLRHPFLTPLKGIIAATVRQDIPYLGICLGGQLLAAAMGARVASHRWEELGTLEVTLTAQGMQDGLFAGIDDRFTTFQWHHDSFDLPEGSMLLASSPACPHQAFRVGTRAWGVQFHPEVDDAIIRTWSAWDRETASRTDELLAAFQKQETAYRDIARRLVGNFVKIAGKG